MISRIRIIRTSSREQGDLLAPRMLSLRAAGFEVLYDDLPPDPTWPYAAASAEARAAALAASLREDGTIAVVCARGGYGASDLLPLLPWKDLQRSRPKILVGFSDVSALHGALYAKLGWSGLHAAMPATVLWEQGGRADDVGALFRILEQLGRGEAAGHTMPLTPHGALAKAADESGGKLEGRLFGGCFTVLTNLIGTPYMPSTLRDHIVFIEDTDENPARLMRAFNQWLQSGLLDGARAVVVGYMRKLGDAIPDCAPFVYEQFARRSPVAVYSTPDFGHTCPNFPLMIGAPGVIAEGRLAWRFQAAAPNS